MIQVYQIGFSNIDSFGDQHFTLSVNGKIENYTFHEGSHMDVQKLCDTMRARLNLDKELEAQHDSK